jgi:hypothetical protein
LSSPLEDLGRPGEGEVYLLDGEYKVLWKDRLLAGGFSLFKARFLSNLLQRGEAVMVNDGTIYIGNLHTKAVFDQMF